MSEATHIGQSAEGSGQGAEDGRRVAGERTRQRLIDATLDLLADRGESGASLRAITEGAGANVAAVSYHFGSKEALVRSAIEQSIDRLVQDQVEGLRALKDPTLEQIAEAWCRPVIRAVAASPCPEQVFMRVVGQTMATCTGERRVQVTQHSSGAVDLFVVALAGVLPELDDDELQFRAAAVGSILTHVTSGAAGLEGKPADEIERLLVPVVAGALRG
jgi:AcrR family transcriptional regulator